MINSNVTEDLDGNGVGFVNDHQWAIRSEKQGVGLGATMDHHIARRLTDDEHGTINAALISYADEVDDSIESRVVRDLAEEIISCDVHFNAAASESRVPGPYPNDQYTYDVHWSPEAHEYVGIVAEFLSVSWLDADPRAALDGIQHLVSEVLGDMAQTEEEPPAPSCPQDGR